MNYYELLSSIAGLGIPFEAYHTNGHHSHETICIPKHGAKCCEILYYYNPEKVEVNGYKYQRSYKRISRDDFNDLFWIILRTMNRNTL